MKAKHIYYYPEIEHHFKSNQFEDDYYDSLLCYSLQHLKFIDNVAQDDIRDAIQKSINICNMAGINSKHHFKKVFVYDANTNTLHIDWLISKKGFNLMVMQIQSLNEKLARWLWQLANL